MSVKKLPDAEFEIMRAVWHTQEPITAPALTKQLSGELPEKDWKPQTVQTMLVRLEKKGFLRSEKILNQRCFYSVISQNEYMKIESRGLRERFAGSSFNGFVKALYDGEDVTAEDVEDLKKWIDNM